MKWLWVVGGAIAGGKAFGFPGAVLGGGIGCGLAALPEILRRLEKVERAAQKAGGSAAAERTAERYPEETIIDAMRQAEDDGASGREELEDIFSEVSGKKKQLH
jgi:hypothetical protein